MTPLATFTPSIARYPSLWRGCIGAWTMSSYQGNRLYDWSGYRHHGTLQDMDPSNDWVPSPCGLSLGFDGTDRVDLGEVAMIDDLDALSVVAWVNNADLSADATVVGRWVTANQQFLLYMDTDGDGDGYRFIVRNEGNGAHSTSTNSVNATQDVWQCVVGTYCSDTVQVWVDGSLRDSAAGGTGIRNVAGNIGIASDHGTTGVRELVGRIAEVRLYDRRLWEHEIKLLSLRPGMSYQGDPSVMRERPKASAAVAIPDATWQAKPAGTGWQALGLGNGWQTKPGGTDWRAMSAG